MAGCEHLWVDADHESLIVAKFVKKAGVHTYHTGIVIGLFHILFQGQLESVARWNTKF